MRQRNNRIIKHFGKKFAYAAGGSAMYALSRANKAYKVAVALKGLFNVERKFVLSTPYVSPLTSVSPQMLFISGVAQGTSSSERTGNKCKCHGISLHGMVRINQTTPKDCQVRVMIIRDKDSHGSAPGIIDVLDSVSPLSHYNNVQCPYRFRVLYNRVFTLSTTGRQIINFNTYIKQQSHMTYSGTTATQADAQANQYYIILITDEPTNGPDVDLNCRLSFVDN